MHHQRYVVKSTNEHRTYEFISEGPKGLIKKLIDFKEIGNNVFNLTFGDWNEAVPVLDDKARSNNHDRDKVLATVAAAVMSFFKYYPKAIVVAKGSTPARTRLYQMGIWAYWQEISILLAVKGYMDDEWQPVEKCKNYDAFMVRMK